MAHFIRERPGTLPDALAKRGRGTAFHALRRAGDPDGGDDARTEIIHWGRTGADLSAFFDIFNENPRLI